MKLFKRYLFLSLCFAFLFSVYSPVNVSAASDTETQIYTVLNYGSNTVLQGMVYPDDDTRQTLTNNLSLTGYNKNTLYYDIYLSNRDKTTLFESGKSVTGTFENIYFVGSSVLPNIATYPITFTNVSASFIYSDGTSEVIYTELSKNNDYYTVTFNGEAEKTVSQVYFQLSTTLSELLPENKFTLNATLGEPSKNVEVNDYITFNALNFSYQSEEVGLLGTIINAITSLPEKIWEKISDGLKSLFIPSEDILIEYKDKFFLLMEERFGFLFQIGDIITDLFDTIFSSDDAQEYIEFPTVTIPLGDTEFTFGGWNVRVVPEGFEAFADTCKFGVGLVCTAMFLNACKLRYERIWS